MIKFLSVSFLWGLALLAIQSAGVLQRFFSEVGSGTSTLRQFSEYLVQPELVFSMLVWGLLILLVQWILAIPGVFMYRFAVPEKLKSIVLAFLFSLLYAALLAMWNAYGFMKSVHAALFQMLRDGYPALAIYYLLIGIFTVLFCVAVYRWTGSRSKLQLATSLSLLGLAVTLIWFEYQRFPGSNKGSVTTDGRPDIILLSVDSLRVEKLEENRLRMPFLTSLVEQSWVAERAYTPISRTYPAWMSILSGQFPHESGVRFNLYPREATDNLPLVSRHLQNNGYNTIYATDEVRFSNISESHGFSQIIGPKSGALDFLQGYLTDFVGVNHLVNSPLGPRLFPYVAANRANANIYKPDSFTHLLRKKLGDSLVSLEGTQRKPVFLSIHYCLPHWPYTFAQPLAELIAPKQHNDGVLNSSYRTATEYTDRQLSATYKMLEKLGLLKNSVVILLSDHGESFIGDPPPRNTLYPEQALTWGSGGHGTSIVGESQFRVLFALNSSDEKLNLPATDAGPLSLIDLAPTIADIADAEPFRTPSGLSLLDENFERKIQARMIVRETGLSPMNMNFEEISASNALRASADLFRLNQQGLLELREENLSDMISKKDRAVQLGRTLTAVRRISTPDRSEAFLQKAVIDLKSNTYFTAAERSKAVASEIQAFCHKWRNDPNFVGDDLCDSQIQDR